MQAELMIMGNGRNIVVRRLPSGLVFFKFPLPNKAYQLSLVGRTPPVNHQTKLIFSAILFCEKDPTFPDKIPTKRSNVKKVASSPSWLVTGEERVCEGFFIGEVFVTAGTRALALAAMAPKKGVKAPVAASKKKPEKVTNPLFEKRPKQFGIGGALPPKRDLTRFVKWPKTVQIQRKKRILKQRLKVPPALNQFTKTLDKNLATSLFKILLKYRPEDRAEKKERLLKRAQAEAEGKTVETKKPINVKFGLKHVTWLIEQNKAQLVVIAHDVDPIELVVWLPALCRKMEIPYCIVKGKARLGTVVHKKTASVLCLTTVKNEDKMEFSRVLEAIKANFNDKYDEYRKKWGGGIMGSKSQAKTKAKERLIAKEAAQRMT
ncbi:60S ribosomal protein L7a-2 [Trifolium repens]|nr:60S ribosomal protein L7a-2 [Trifolium repens]